MSHIQHPDTHTHGLCDDCLGCAEIAERPTSLDATNLRRLWRGEIHTRRDMDAYNALYRAAVIAQRLGEAFQWEGFEGRPIGAVGATALPPAPDLFTIGGKA